MTPSVEVKKAKAAAGSKGGKATQSKLTAEERSALARKAAAARFAEERAEGKIGKVPIRPVETRKPKAR